MKKRIYMVQVCSNYDGITTLPYSIGVLAAYAWQNETISENFELKPFIVDRIDLSEAVKQFLKPDVIAFSCYVWNFEYSKSLAEVVKKEYPNCKVVFGGHSIPIYNANMLREYDFIDILIHGEGEIPFEQLLLYYSGALKLSDVPNISFIDDENKLYFNYDKSVFVQDYPSPYLGGFFDDLILDQNKRFAATFESNRGCPFGCAYCDWGLNKSKLRMMNEEKILKEIEWMAKNKVYICNGADSNFGMFERDERIAQKIIDMKNLYGYPHKFSVSFSKISDLRVLHISDMLHKGGVISGATLSFQSLNEKTLEIIRRKNLTLEKFRNLMSKYNEKLIPTYSEIILGLPAETYESFVEGICLLIKSGQYKSINIYNLAILINSELGEKNNLEKYAYKTAKFPLKPYYCKLDNVKDKISEYSEIVVQSSTLTNEEWVECKLFASVIKTYHSFGILLYLTSYLNNENICSYKEFYTSFCKWLSIHENLLSYTYIKQKQWWKSISSNLIPNEERVDVYNGYIMTEEEAAFLTVSNDIDTLYDIVKEFLSDCFENDMYLNILEFQIAIFKLLYSNDDDKKSIRFEYDFTSYFNNIATGKSSVLGEKRITITKANVCQMKLQPKIIKPLL